MLPKTILLSLLAILPMAFAAQAEPQAGQPSVSLADTPSSTKNKQLKSHPRTSRVSNKHFGGTGKHVVGRRGHVLVNPLARRGLSDDGEMELERRDGGFTPEGVEELAERDLDFESGLEERDFDPEEEIEELFARDLDFEVEERAFEPEEDLELFERDLFEMEPELLERDFGFESDLELAERDIEDDLD